MIANQNKGLDCSNNYPYKYHGKFIESTIENMHTNHGIIKFQN